MVLLFFFNIAPQARAQVAQTHVRNWGLWVASCSTSCTQEAGVFGLPTSVTAQAFPTAGQGGTNALGTRMGCLCLKLQFKSFSDKSHI